jgi:PEP-CTERM motif
MRSPLLAGVAALILTSLALPGRAEAQTDQQVRDLIDLLNAPTFAVRENAQKTLEGFIANNRLTPEQYGILRTYPQNPPLELLRRRNAVLATWTWKFPAVRQAVDETKLLTLDRSWGRDWYFKIGGFFGGANTGDPTVVKACQLYEAASNALLSADTATAVAKVTELRNYILDPKNFPSFNLASNADLSQRITRQQAAAVFDMAIDSTMKAVQQIRIGSNNVKPPPQGAAPVNHGGLVNIGLTPSLFLSGPPVTPGALAIFQPTADLALSQPPAGYKFVGEIFELRAIDGLDVTGRDVTFGIELAPSIDLTGLALARLANGQLDVLSDSVVDPMTHTVSATYLAESLASGQDQFGTFAVVCAVPEPASVALLGMSLVFLLVCYRRGAAKRTACKGKHNTRMRDRAGVGLLFRGKQIGTRFGPEWRHS